MNSENLKFLEAKAYFTGLNILVKNNVIKDSSLLYNPLSFSFYLT